MFSFRMCQEAVTRETTEGPSIEFIGYRIPKYEQNDCTVLYTKCKYGGPLGHRPGRVAWKVRLVRPRCFVLTMLPLKSLASWTV